MAWKMSSFRPDQVVCQFSSRFQYRDDPEKSSRKSTPILATFATEAVRPFPEVCMPDFTNPTSISLKLDDALSLDERLLNAQEVADRLGVSERWVRDHATRRKPRLPAIKLGPLLRFRWSDIQIFVAKFSADSPFKSR
jgi:hypothetical protein